ncbi:MarR family winged helix-turn-helix transcriptional regulator [Azohydromonas caseinilytica]|uniref:MarR family winged helix-turn-helix transcriptional regulator n=1 Tax=Azohydromonas caseinilytica TaxID=2728836 RepID=UPI00197BE5E4|nr:MarR family winged helix-turn-helix transcriptional regulator [Azohydromonas caseinilytica]
MPTARSPKSAPVQQSRHDELAGEVLRQFRQVFNAVKTHFQQVERTVGLGGAQVWALSVIRDHAGIRVTELAQAMDIHQSTASNLVKGLIERDLVESVKDGPDRRVVRLKLKPAGANALKAVPGPFEGVLPNALHAMDAATLKRLHADLRALLAVLHADEEAAQVPLAEM